MVLGPRLLVAPLGAAFLGGLERRRALVSLRVTQVVCCGQLSPELTPLLSDGRACIELPLPLDLEAATNLLATCVFAQDGSTHDGSTLLLGDCCTLAAACLIVSDGLSAYDAILRVRRALPKPPPSAAPSPAMAPSALCLLLISPPHPSAAGARGVSRLPARDAATRKV